MGARVKARYIDSDGDQFVILVETDETHPEALGTVRAEAVRGVLQLLTQCREDATLDELDFEVEVEEQGHEDRD